MAEVLATKENIKDAKEFLIYGVENFNRKVVDSFIEKNAKFHFKSGLAPQITRTAHAGACKWCLALEGSYDYPKVPKDIYRRHTYCRCIVEYLPIKGKRQSVHTKRWIETNNSGRIKRNSLSNNKKRKTLKKPNILTKNFVKGSGKNYPIKISNSQYAKFDSKEVTNVVAIAGYQTSEDIKDLNRLENLYGQPKRMWQKVGGRTFIKFNKERMDVEIHWYEVNKIRKEIKVKKIFDDES